LTIKLIAPSINTQEIESTINQESMMADEITNKCKHGPCDCAAEKDSKYCGEYCKEADKSHVMEIGCGCEHDGCR
jgi:hypothetical protein